MRKTTNSENFLNTSEDLEELEMVDLDEDDTEQDYLIDANQYWDLLEKQKKQIDLIVTKAILDGRSDDQIEEIRTINRDFMAAYHALVRKHYID